MPVPHHCSSLKQQYTYKTTLLVRRQEQQLLLGRIAVLCRCGLPLQMQGTAWHVCHDFEPSKNGWTNQDVVWDVDSGGTGGPKEPCIRRRSRSPMQKGTFEVGGGWPHPIIQPPLSHGYYDIQGRRKLDAGTETNVTHCGWHRAAGLHRRRLRSRPSHHRPTSVEHISHARHANSQTLT